MKAKVLKATGGGVAAATTRVRRPKAQGPRRETRAEARARAEAAFGMLRKHMLVSYEELDRILAESKRERIELWRRSEARWKRDPKTGDWQKGPW